MANPDAPRWPPTKLTRRAFNARLTAPFFAAAATVLTPIIASCQRTDSDEPPGKRLLDKGAQAGGEALRKLAGMDQTPTPAYLQAGEIKPRPTIAAPNLQSTPKPTEKSKKEGDFEITLNPEELHRALLTTAFDQNNLPVGFTLEKGPYPFSLDNTFTKELLQSIKDPVPTIVAKPFKPLAEEIMFQLENNSGDSQVISYIVFNDNKDAESAFNALSSQPNMRSLDDPNLHGVVYRSLNPGYFQFLILVSVFTAVQVKNILIYAGSIGKTYSNPEKAKEGIETQEPATILLVKAGLEHLKRVASGEKSSAPKPAEKPKLVEAQPKQPLLAPTPTAASKPQAVESKSQGAVGRQVPIEGNIHVAEGSPIQYKDYPPSSGPHYPSPNPWGVYTKEVPEGTWVHNLEHSGVVILYKCDQSCPDLERQLANLYQTFPPSKFGNVKLVITPYSKLKNKITAVAWGWIDEMDSFDRDRLLRFYNAYVNSGPEQVP